MSKQFITDCFSFTKKERTGITVILIIILLIFTVPFFYQKIKPSTVSKQSYEIEIANLQLKKKDSVGSFKKQSYYKNDYTKQANETINKTIPHLFYFDPNTTSEQDWQKLGLRDKTIQTILHFTQKGGKFYKPEDIRKIWGLRTDEIDRLLPYIQILSKNPTIQYEKKVEQRSATNYIKKIISPIEINMADTGLLIALPGIGAKLSQRIITFRDKLGGFYSINQIAETFGLPDSTFQKIKQHLVLQSDQVKKININAATIDELKIHPYLRFGLANAIVQYRNQHGNFATIAELKKIMLFTDEVYEKVVPYLRVK